MGNTQSLDLNSFPVKVRHISNYFRSLYANNRKRKEQNRIFHCNHILFKLPTPYSAIYENILIEFLTLWSKRHRMPFDCSAQKPITKFLYAMQKNDHLNPRLPGQGTLEASPGSVLGFFKLGYFLQIERHEPRCDGKPYFIVLDSLVVSQVVLCCG